MQLALFTLKNRISKEKSPIEIEKYDLSDNFTKTLPFTLTNDQIKSIEEIKKDFRSGYPMHRLLQGDVGSGKTVIALYLSLIHI